LIPRANITAWRAVAPWPSNEQVEQDLVLSRALVAIFSHKVVADRAVFRGGTALHKLFFGTRGRYSEDIDLAAVSRAEFEANLAAKLASAAFLEDLRLLVPPEVEYDPVKAAELINEQLIAKLPGEPWKGPGA